MKIGLHMGPYLGRPFGEFFPQLADWGYEAVELCSWEGVENVAKPGIEATRQALESAGLEVSSIAAHQRWVGVDESATEAALGHTKRCLDIACDLGCPVLATESGPHVEGVDRHAAWDRLMRGMSAAVEYAQKRQVRIGMEAHFGSIVFTWESVLKLLTEIGSPYFRVNCDCAHWHGCGLDHTVAFEKLKDYIIHVHLKDYSFVKPSLRDGYLEPIFRGNALGDGEFGLELHIAQLHAIGYRGALSGEFTAVEPAELDTVAQRSARYLRLILQQYR